MYAEIQAALASVQSASQMLSAAKGVVEQAKIAAAIHEISAKLMSANASALQLMELNSALQKRVLELEQKAAEAKNWEAQASKYKVAEIATGVFAMVTDRGMCDLQSAVKLCHRCFQRKQTSILQADGDQTHSVTLRCAECMSDLRFPKYL
jgi:hypothetical protein